MNHNIERAITLANKAAHADSTAQPRLAQLYIKNMVAAIDAARIDVRRERVSINPFKAFAFFAEDVEEQFIKPLRELVGGFVEFAASTQQDKKSDFALAAPGGAK